MARRRLCGMGCAKGNEANGATAEGGAVSSEGRCDPVAGCTPHHFRAAVVASPSLPAPASRVPRATLRGARRCTPWHRSPSYDLRRAPCDHPDFTCNALHGHLFRGSLKLEGLSTSYTLGIELSSRDSDFRHDRLFISRLHVGDENPNGTLELAQSFCHEFRPHVAS